MNLDTLEDQIEKPGYLLLLTAVLMLLIIGWVNLISVQSETPVIFNWFSVPQTIIFVLYTIGTIRWAMLLRHPNNDTWFVNLINTLQNRVWLGLLTLAVLTGILASMFVPTQLMDIWLFYPAVVASYIIVFLILIAILLITRLNDASRPKVWKWLGFAAIGIVAVELLLQAGTLVGITPAATSLRDPISPYGRIYYKNSEGDVINSRANNYGWHYPDFRLEEDSHLIAISGDAHVKGYGLPAEQNLGVQLDGLVVETADSSMENPEVISLGFPDYGTGLFLSHTTIGHNQENLEFDDLIILFDPKSDFQTVTAPSDEGFFYYEENGELVIDEGSWHLRHDTAHFTLWYSDGVKPNRLINSHVMLARMVQSLLSSESTAPKVPAPQEDIKLPNSFMFYEDTDDNGQFIVEKQLESLVDEVIAPRDMQMLFVTIPPFTAEFFEQTGSDWSTQYGEADLFLPERELRNTAAAQQVSFLGMGEYMQAKNLTVAEIQDLFLSDGTGYFSAEGHKLFADAIHECFYEQSIDESFGCDSRK